MGGHHAGDMLLGQVAHRLRGLVRDDDTVARLGGDEFAIFVLGEPTEAGALAARIHKRLGEPFYVEGELVQIGVSIGIALYPEHADDGSVLLRRADVAMYHAKRHRTGPRLYDTDDVQAA